MEHCLVYRGPLNHAGYGRAWLDGRNWQVHRYVWVRANGPVPPDLEVMHTCGGPRACFRLSHLRVGTHLENMADARSFNREKTHCAAGHPYDETNTYPRPDGRGRECRACRREAQRRYREGR